MIRQLIATLLTTLAFGAFAAVDANQANQAELESVKGIGPGLSGKILQARQASAFKNWGDLVDRVSGIGPGNAARFSQAGLTVGGQVYAAVSAPTDKAEKPMRARAERKAKPADGAPR